MSESISSVLAKHLHLRIVVLGAITCAPSLSLCMLLFTCGLVLKGVPGFTQNLLFYGGCLLHFMSGVSINFVKYPVTSLVFATIVICKCHRLTILTQYDNVLNKTDKLLLLCCDVCIS